MEPLNDIELMEYNEMLCFSLDVCSLDDLSFGLTIDVLGKDS